MKKQIKKEREQGSEKIAYPLASWALNELIIGRSQDLRVSSHEEPWRRFWMDTDSRLSTVRRVCELSRIFM
jgi:hypothetical protein